ncbi:hypothetical protein GYA28_00275 [Candidatus Roizmanbacteria bacterium]|jgi:hypothetical protein|nr:hypothetical protein [Candidatus Roizmanbacteria bacterium]
MALKKTAAFFLLFLLFLFVPLKPTQADDYTADYDVNYYLVENGSSLQTEVGFNIKTTNLRSDIYVKKFSLIFPSSFKVSKISAFDDRGEVVPKIVSDDQKITIELEFSDPNTGKGSVNNFYVKFFQENLFKVNGNVWEVILPTVDNRSGSNYRVNVVLPKNTEKKISIAKPKPDSIVNQGDFRSITWNNPTSKTIYAVFGEYQYYQAKLTYNLKNSKLVPVFTEIALPPDTLYQKTFLQHLNPQPSSVYVDEDGNFMARYFLKPKENMTVNYQGIIKVFNQARPDFLPVIRSTIEQQKKYLLTEKPLWKINPDVKINSLKSMADIYGYLVGQFQYDYKKALSLDSKRLGAQQAWLNPKSVVCTEFADLFVALSREKGIPAREIEGYGFSADPQLRPLSLASDVLHAWPEYYDESKKIWIPIDPTWENTSGIDYHSSFDLNHVVFAIHGKDPQYPYPAGMYKIENSKDIIINAVNQEPEEKTSLEGRGDFLKKINNKNIYQGKITIKNNGNVFLNDLNFSLDSPDISINPSALSVTSIAPLETKEFSVSYSSTGVKRGKKSKITLSNQYGKIFDFDIEIVDYYADLEIKISLGILFLVLVFLAGRFLWTKK